MQLQLSASSVVSLALRSDNLSLRHPDITAMTINPLSQRPLYVTAWRLISGQCISSATFLVPSLCQSSDELSEGYFQDCPHSCSGLPQKTATQIKRFVQTTLGMYACMYVRMHVLYMLGPAKIYKMGLS